MADELDRAMAECGQVWDGAEWVRVDDTRPSYGLLKLLLSEARYAVKYRRNVVNDSADCDGRLLERIDEALVTTANAADEVM